MTVKLVKGKGRPMRYKNASELKAAIDAYFESCWMVDGNSRVRIKPYTITGLGLAIGLDRGQLIDYGKREIFADVVRWSVNTIREDVEARLLEGGKSAAGAIFWLKNNAGWMDSPRDSKDTPKDEDKGLRQHFAKSAIADSK